MGTNFAANPRIQRWAGLLVLMTVTWSVAMSIQVAQFDGAKSDVVKKCGAPVACLELAKQADAVRELVDAGNCSQKKERSRTVNFATLRSNTYMDCIFIFLYCAALILLAHTYSGIPILPALTTVSVIVAGVFDYA